MEHIGVHVPESAHSETQLLSPKERNRSVQAKGRICYVFKDVQIVEPVRL